VIGGAAWQADEAAERRAVHDHAAALGAHVAQFVFHAGPNAAQVDGVDPIEALGRLVRCIARRRLDAGIVVGHVEPAEGGDRPLDHRGDLVLVRHVASHGQELATGVFKASGGCIQSRTGNIGQHDGSTGIEKRLRGREADAGAGAGDERNLAFEVIGDRHAQAPGWYWSSLTFSIHSTFLPCWLSWTAMWLMAVVGLAPCQCFSPGGNQTTSPARISSMGPPSRCT
jgi:hypothetical protein